MAFIDKQLTCRDCSNNFVFTGGEQEFYASKGLQNEPVRCPPCRSARKTNRLNEPEEGYVKYGVFASFGGRTPRQMHPATCADCGIMTEVPFQPRGDRPVYCSSCYNKVKAAQEAAEAAAEGSTKAARQAGAAADEKAAIEAQLSALAGAENPSGAAETEPAAEEEAVSSDETKAPDKVEVVVGAEAAAAVEAASADETESPDKVEAVAEAEAEA